MMGPSESETPVDTGPATCLPPWGVDELPEPRPLRWRNWTAFIGPGIVMMGIQIAGGEWLLGPEMTAKYGGAMMWIATIAILGQVFYNMECGRYALYCGEPIFTGFLRTRPGPAFWTSFFILLSIGAIVPGMIFHAGSVLATWRLGRAPTDDDRGLVLGLSYAAYVAVVLPVLFGGKVYNVLQVVMTAKVFIVLGFCLVVGVLFVSPASWLDVFSGFLKFGAVPVVSEDGETEEVVNAFGYLFEHGSWPLISMANIAVLGAFAGFAGGGGLGNSLYSNFVRDKGWGMGSRVGAIPSAIGGKKVTLSHLGKIFPLSAENLRRWKGWWRYIITDQVFVWAPGCFIGMALPALISLEFARESALYGDEGRFDWAQAVISADGMRNAFANRETLRSILWFGTLFVGLAVLMPSQMSVVEDVSRRWTDVIWSGNKSVRDKMQPKDVKKIYYAILALYVGWSLASLWWFGTYGTPKLMVLIIANLGNFALGITAFLILRVNTRLLPKPLRPRWHHRVGLVCCGTFYLGMALLVFVNKQIPLLLELLGIE